MFTGIIGDCGSLVRMSKQGKDGHLTIKSTFTDFVDGESIAVNGCCLSVESHDAHTFTVYASEETFARTTLGQMKDGSRLNLERALRLSDRLGGHLVTGHVDATAQIIRRDLRGSSLSFAITVPQGLEAQIVAKGSIALDGISLTVNDTDRTCFHVNCIPDTQKRTTISTWLPGTLINLETDLFGKYVQHLLEKESTQPTSSTLDLSFLAQHGFL